ncbi:cytochrome C [Lysobacter sp. SG-8]|uniref:Cytochrome C n=1 Tax=Marilutibacter penaei TaxID=2759900 RepID=A0A7W3YDP4_9GAMM|nr:tetratricopeptide repeat protein [Lysobacter penaei]MBB1087242.1 cytochrome C [Lysobacter penaei]
MGKKQRRDRTKANVAAPPETPGTGDGPVARRFPWLVVVLVLLATAIAAWFAWRAMRDTAPTTAAVTPPASVADAHYVGADTCAGCHAPETEAWKTSQHARAMQHADAGTVLGDFNDASFEHNGVSSRFFRKGEEFWVTTDGPDGTLQDFQVAYTFGVEPLQQYLIAFPDGRLQALGIAWDSRPADAGGQRWFHLYPDEAIAHDDPLHWTGRDQNWNFMCADCHSTDLRRNYDATDDRYATTWQDINVACESCHGPASQHVAWAQGGADAAVAHKGLSIRLDARDIGTWVAVAGTGNVRRSEPLAHHAETETCAVCHSRRASISTTPGPTGELLDTHLPSLLTAGLYFDDGQQRDEVFIHGSFLQSKMHAAGVTCSDCHDPHTAKLRFEGNANCTQCHAPSTFDTPAHHRHSPVPAATLGERPGDGTQCVDCHMPERTYMVVDPRRDHSFRIPRPDLSVAIGTPNACQACHAGQGDAWAAAALERWHGPPKPGFQHWAPAFHAARSGGADAAQQLQALFDDPTVPPIVRATALEELRRFPGRGLLAAIDAGLRDDSALVRLAAVEALTEAPPEAALGALQVADDPRLAVRATAGLVLAAAPADRVPTARRTAVAGAIEDYLATQRATLERPEANLNLGVFHGRAGNAAGAELAYREAMRRDPAFVPARANLADLLRATGRDGEAGQVLEEGLALAPDDPALLHALGLQRVRGGQTGAAIDLLARAAHAAPGNARYAYVHAVAVHSQSGAAAAIPLLDRALDVAPNDPELLFARTSYALETGDTAAARRHAERFRAAAPDDPRSAQLAQVLD